MFSPSRSRLPHLFASLRACSGQAFRAARRVGGTDLEDPFFTTFAGLTIRGLKPRVPLRVRLRGAEAPLFHGYSQA